MFGEINPRLKRGLAPNPTYISTTGVLNNIPVASNFIVFTGNSTVQPTGFQSQADGTRITVFNQLSGGNVVVLTHQSSSSLDANRIITPNAGNSIIPNATGVDLVMSRGKWVYADGYAPSSTTNSGYLAAADFQTFAAKPNGVGVASSVAYWSAGGSPSTLAADGYFVYVSSSKRFGVGVIASASEATGHFKSDVAETIPGPSSFSSVLNQFVLLTAPSYTPTQSPGHLYAVSSLTPNVTPDSTNYISGDSIDYRITAYDSTGTLTYSVVSATTNAVIGAGTGASDGDQVGLSWAPNTSGTATISGYIIERNINSAGWNDYADIGSTNSVTDDSVNVGGVAWTGGSFSFTPLFPDFIANNSTRNYTSYSKGLTPRSTDVYSGSGTAVAFMDDNSGNPYVILHSSSGGGGSTYRVLNTDLTTYADGTSFYEDTVSPFVAGSTVTPTTYGILSVLGTGTDLNRAYTSNTYYPVQGIYSTGQSNGTVTDPQDGNYYYVSINTNPGSASYKVKVLRNLNGAGYNDAILTPLDSYSFLDDGVTTWPDSTTLTPTDFYAPTSLFESHGSGLTASANAILRSLDGDYTRLDFQDSTSTRTAYIENGSNFSLSTSKTILLSSADNISINATNTVTTTSIFKIFATTTAWSVDVGGANKINIRTTGVGIGSVAVPSAYLHLAAGTTTAGTAPLKFTAGSSNTVAVAGAVEYDGTGLFITGTSAIRYVIPWVTGVVAQGDIIYGSATSIYSRLAKNTSATRYLSNTGTSNNPAWAQIDLTNGVTGTLPIANGGTGSTSTTYVSLTANVSGILPQANGGTGVAKTILFDHFTDANNGTTVETDLYSDTLAAGQFSANGQKIVTQYGGTFVGDATSTQRIKMYFGGTLIFDTGALGIGVTTSNWDIYATVIRVSSSVVRCSVTLNTSFATLNAYAQYTEVTGLTLANTQIVKITGTAAGVTAASNQITAKEGYIQFLPAA